MLAAYRLGGARVGPRRRLLPVLRILAATLGLCLGALGCGHGSSAPGGGDAAPDGGTLTAQAGFVDLEPVTYVLDGEAQVSGEGRLWYAFQPAASDPADEPLFVLFNGGPGDSTTEELFACNTANDTVDPFFADAGPVKASPAPWTAMGNLLYVDARETGFSYDVTGDPSDAGARQAGFSNASFSASLDAADFVRVVLRFLDGHAALRKSPVVLVGESYGGVRATAMLYDLLHAGSLRETTSAYVDAALADEIDAHFAAIVPGLSGSASPAQAAVQFGRQVLIEPLLLGTTQFEVAGQLLNEPGSPLFALGKSIGKPYVPCSCGTNCGDAKSCQRLFVVDAGRDPHDVDVPLAAQNARQATIEATLSDPAHLSEVLGLDAGAIPLLSAKDRGGAFRTVSTSPPPWTPPDESGLRSALGSLEPWDWYLLETTPDVTKTRIVDDANLATWGTEFLTDLPYVKTFITDAGLDVVIYSPSIPATLAQAYPGVVQSVTTDSAARPGVARPGWFTVTYAAGAVDGPTPSPQTVRFPPYAASGHQVAAAQPVELEADVAAWLAEP